MTVFIRNARDGRGGAIDIAVRSGVIDDVGPRLGGHGEEIDAHGALALPGLHDHHIHILATAARRSSVDLAGLVDAPTVQNALRGAAAARSIDRWIRAVGYDERAAGVPDRVLLDTWVGETPVRLQDRTGALWVLNSAGLRRLEGQRLPPGCERDAEGRPNGRFWREDRWLGEALKGDVPDITALATVLAQYGVTGLTDAGATNGAEAAATLSAARRSRALPQRLVLMGDESLPAGVDYLVGPLKLMIDERAPPGVEELAHRVRAARGLGRRVAAHCVTDAELALYLAALEEAGGARGGDRIEHGAMIPEHAIAVIAALRLTVVANPVFVHDRGDRYRAEIAAPGWSEICRLASLARAGVSLAAGSDAPYASIDPWRAMRAARDRVTAAGQTFGAPEAISARRALGLYLKDGAGVDGPERRLARGAAADLILCRGGVRDVLGDLSAERVEATIMGGAVVYRRR